MTHLLDTNICSAHMRRPGGLAHRFFQYASGIAISTVVLAELYSGAYNHPNPSRLLALIADLLQEVAALNTILGTDLEPIFQDPRAGDVHDSLASLDRIQKVLGYKPIVSFEEGLRRTVEATVGRGQSK